MLNWYEAWITVQSRQREGERAARHQQLLREVSAAVERRPGLGSRLFLTIGTWLIEQGWRLHRRGNASARDVLRWGKIEVHRWVEF